MTATSRPTHVATISGSAPSPETSLTTLAPASTAARATSAFIVSIDTGTFTSAATASITGITRRSSSAVPTGSAPGRVDSPPTSIIAAPESTITRARSTAASSEMNSPPSEKLSGVTFRIPINHGSPPRTCVVSPTRHVRPRLVVSVSFIAEPLSTVRSGPRRRRPGVGETPPAPSTTAPPSAHIVPPAPPHRASVH